MVAVGAVVGGTALPATVGGWLRGAAVFGVVLAVEEALLSGVWRAGERAAEWREPPRVVPRRRRRHYRSAPPPP